MRDENAAVNGCVHSNSQNGVCETRCDSAAAAEAMTPVLKEMAMHAYYVTKYTFFKETLILHL